MTERDPSGPGPAQWLAADATPFGVPVLDLISITGGLMSTTKDPREAEMAVSWDGKTVDELAADMNVAATLPGPLRYPAEDDLPDGFLFTPRRMEDKWVIALRAGHVLFARSWSGQVKARAAARREGRHLVLASVDVADDGWAALGEPVQIIDWLIRSHALGQRLPLPVHAEGAQLLEEVPLLAFSHFGYFAACAARNWSPTEPARPLRATSALVTATRQNRPERVAQLAESGLSLDARAAVGGYTALHVASVQGNVAMARQLLDLGADPNVVADRGQSALIVAIVQRAPLELIELLLTRGARATHVNDDGFGALHAIAEIDHPEALSTLLAAGLDLELRTGAGHTPLHIAAALGHTKALRALLQAGASATARAADGAAARDIAISQGQQGAVEVLDAWLRDSP